MVRSLYIPKQLYKLNSTASSAAFFYPNSIRSLVQRRVTEQCDVYEQSHVIYKQTKKILYSFLEYT